MAVIVYKCANCGGGLEFKAESQDFSCDYCGSVFLEEEINAAASSETQTREIDAEFVQQAKMYSCNSCGAEIVTDETTTATFCYYCHNPAIIAGRLADTNRPAKLIPFQIDKEKATEKFISWCKSKPLLSKTFTTHSELEKLTGIYVPFWLFDCDIRGSMRGEGKNVRSYTRGDYKYTETKYYRVAREGNALFRGLPADGSKKMDDQLMHILEPYDYNQLIDFSMSYLSGYYAEKYDLDHKEVFGGVSNRIRDYSKSLLRDTIGGYSSVHIKSTKIDIKRAKATYALLPVWVFTYNYKGKTYIFAMNGQTGKIAGRLPISPKRMATWFGMISGGAFALFSIWSIGSLYL
ncbi:hypothetical protein [Caldalkalibacillus mannanilyticus]|uniref:hypothetical protein n=1 Tax=Caldalkalibacillus mannanilyticus TaxID=1418 RepID=UPI000469ECC0|nr:hypothetical protein [Caldalkalibacillus mannanilyticus]